MGNLSELRRLVLLRLLGGLVVDSAGYRMRAVAFA